MRAHILQDSVTDNELKISYTNNRAQPKSAIKESTTKNETKAKEWGSNNNKNKQAKAQKPNANQWFYKEANMALKNTWIA